MLTVALVKFDKKRNSTLRPKIFLEENLFQGEIKSDFTMEALEIAFSFNDPSNPPEYNYAYIYPFKRFYFIRQWVFSGGIWIASLVVDVLATYRNEFKTHKLFCVRSANFTYSNIIDSSYPTSGYVGTASTKISPDMFWGNSILGGAIICGIVGSSGANIGAVTYYAFTFAAFNNFMNRLLSGISWAGIDTDEISEELQKALINPSQYIVSCVWLPLGVSDITGTATSTIKLGWWSFSVSGSVKILSISNAFKRVSYALSIPKHPQDTMGYHQLSPYSSYSLKFLPFGVFEIDTTKLYGKDRLYVQVSVDLLTGGAILDVSIEEDFQAAMITSQANIGIQIPTGQIAANLGNLDQALIAGGIAGASDLVAAFNAADNQATIAKPSGGTTTNKNGFSHKGGGF